MKTLPSIFSVSLLLLSLSAASADSPSLEQLVHKATQTLEARQGSAEHIPETELLSAKGAAILSITKAGFVVGATRGSGVVMVRTERGLSGLLGLESWSAPIPVQVTGGSIGAQIGKDETDTIILLKTQAAVDAFTRPGELKWDAKATGTAGAETRTQALQGDLTDDDITVYQKTQGVYGGATFGGSQLAIKDDTLHAAYGEEVFIRDILDGQVDPPEYAERLISLLDGIR